MNAKKRRNFSGAFLPQECGNGAWHLSRAAPHETEVIVQGADRGAARAFGSLPVMNLGIEWDTDTARLSFASGGGAATVAATSVIVHEPLGHLYEGLPLVKFDADARRFWRRVFRLVRIPGGRYLLKCLTRSTKPRP